MNLLFKIIRISSAAFFGISTLLLAALLGFFLYTAYPGAVGILTAVIFIAAGFYSGFLIFRTARSRGILSFITAVNASPDLDSLPVQERSSIRKTGAASYANAYRNGDSRFAGGSIQIWGDWKRRNLEKKHIICGVDYHKEEEILRIKLKDTSQLTIHNPGTIVESSDYLKVVSADKVMWQWPSKPAGSNLFCYWAENNMVRTMTNSDWKSEPFDILPEKPPLLMTK